MYKLLIKFNPFREKRLVFEGHEKPPEVISSADQKKGQEVLTDVLRNARAKAKTQAISEGKAKVVSPTDKPVESTKKPAEKLKTPEIPAKITGLHFDLKDAKPPIPPNGTIEQPFQFGDLKIKGKIIFPDKPDNGPNAKTTYIFNYVDDPNKFDHSKFLDKLKDQKASLGNTVIITLRTPEGETTVNQKKVNTMEQIMANVEKYQADLSQNTRFANIKMPRATDIFHLTSNADPEKAQRTNAMLTKYVGKLQENDSRWLSHPKPLDTSTPETLAASLEAILAPPAPEPTKDQTSPEAPVSSGGGGKRSRHGGGTRSAGRTSSGEGRVIGGGVIEAVSGASKAAASSAIEQPAVTVKGESPISPDKSPVESQDRGPGVNNVLMVGDSLMVGVGKLRANFVENSKETVQGGRQLSEMLSRLKKWDIPDGQGARLKEFQNETMVINGGTNDLARLKIPDGKGDFTKESIFGNMKEIWNIAKKYNIKIFQCAIPPFGGTSYKSLGNNFEEREAARLWINAQMRAMKGQSAGPTDIIELDLPKSQGGLAAESADPNDHYPSRLAAEYRAGDGIHFTSKGRENMTALIQKAIGEPISPDRSDSTDSALATEQSHPTLVPYHQETPAYNNWAASINKQFIESGAKYGTFKVVEYNGTKLIAKYTQHKLQATTGKHGKFSATETYEYNPDFDKTQKKA